MIHPSTLVPLNPGSIRLNATYFRLDILPQHLFDEATLFATSDQFVEGDYTITVMSTDLKVKATQNVTLQIPPTPTLEISEKTPDKITGKISDPKAKVQVGISQEEIPVNATGEFTITSPGIGDVTITAINWAGKERKISVTIEDKGGGDKGDEIVLPPPLRITQPRLNQKIQFSVGDPVNFNVTATGGAPPYDYSAEGCPPGAVLSQTTGQFAWPSAVEGNYPVTLTVSDTTGKQDQMPIQIIISPRIEPLRITQPLPNQEFSADESEPIQFPVEATGGTPPYRYTPEKPPPGAEFTNGQFQWKNTVKGSHPVKLTVSDQAGQRATVPVTITIRDIGDMVLTLNPQPPPYTRDGTVTIKGNIKYQRLGHLISDVLKIQGDGGFQYLVDLKEGVNTISLSVRDKNNPQKQVERTITIVRDTKSPSFSYNGKPTTQIIRSKEDTTAISVTVVDETSPLSSVAPSWGERPQPSGKEHSMRIQAAALGTGDNQLTAVDAAGNSAVLKVIVIPPLEVRITDPKPGTITKENSILVKGTVTGGYGGIALKVGNRTLTPSQGSFSVDAPLNEGENKIMVVPQDDLGEKPPIGVTVTRDVTKPVFIYNGRPVTSIERSIVEGDFTIGINDESGIASVTLNAKGISSRDGKTWTIPVNDLKRGDTKNEVLDLAPRWSPDGKHLVYSSDLEGNMDIFLLKEVLASDGKRLNPESQTILLTSSQLDETYPTWSPDGELIAFYSIGLESEAMSNIKKDGENPNLTPSDETDVAPDDGIGQHIRSEKRSCDLWVVKPDGSKPIQVAKGVYRQIRRGPVWVPPLENIKGRYLIYTSGTYDQIYVLNVDGAMENPGEVKPMPIEGLSGYQYKHITDLDCTKRRSSSIALAYSALDKDEQKRIYVEEIRYVKPSSWLITKQILPDKSRELLGT
ncbi:PD40 domain-containing protein [Candidatus Poribacteria bacterium]|nr:PD40 domain-containing protein [Candidatus Poribacteria bacterium]